MSSGLNFIPNANMNSKRAGVSTPKPLGPGGHNQDDFEQVS